MEIMDDLKTAYAIMGKTGWEETDDGMFEQYAHLFCIDLEKNEIVHKFNTELRRDSKLLLANGKGIILEPFRALKMHSFEGTEIKEIPVGSEIVQLDGFEKCLKYNALLVLCEKR